MTNGPGRREEEGGSLVNLPYLEAVNNGFGVYVVSFKSLELTPVYPENLRVLAGTNESCFPCVVNSQYLEEAFPNPVLGLDSLNSVGYPIADSLKIMLGLFGKHLPTGGRFATWKVPGKIDWPIPGFTDEVNRCAPLIVNAVVDDANNKPSDGRITPFLQIQKAYIDPTHGPDPSLTYELHIWFTNRELKNPMAFHIPAINDDIGRPKVEVRIVQRNDSGNYNPIDEAQKAEAVSRVRLQLVRVYVGGRREVSQPFMPVLNEKPEEGLFDPTQFRV